MAQVSDMVRRSVGWLAGATLFSGFVAGIASAGQEPYSAERFERKVRPALSRNCVACHNGKAAKGGLDLDRLDLLASSAKGALALSIKDPGQSKLLKAIRHEGGAPAMPPSGKLPQSDISEIEAWIRAGAPVPKTVIAGANRPDPRRHWAFQPLQKSMPPTAAGRPDWKRTRIDRYLLSAMRSEGLQPANEASRAILLRRAAVDLTGIPPTPEEVAEFIRDTRPDAYERQLDRLLASPHYGERWGRHWLDLVRYCDVPESWAQTDASAWLYRDWVIQAFNSDMPYDRFVKLQLAADEMPGTAPRDLAALGFLGLSPSYWKELKLAPDVIKTVFSEEWEERIHTLSSTLVGLTIACARCHDHKFDPVTSKDYYALAGIFASTRLTARPLLPEPEAKQVLTAREKLAVLDAELKKLQSEAGRARPASPEKQKRLDELAAAISKLKSDIPRVSEPVSYSVDTASVEVLPDGEARTRIVWRDGVGQDIEMQLRGNPATLGGVTRRSFPTILSGGREIPLTRGSGRAELGEAFVKDASSLTARVIVNRVWRHHFGRGIVETVSNFGLLGDRPSHPQLLDDLSSRFIAAGWSLKWLHREIMLSSAYRQGPGDAISARKDPENKWVARQRRRRVEIEVWRDSLLAATGALDRTIGGPARELAEPTNRRRTVYGAVRRRELDELLRLYDFPDPTTHSAARFDTTTPIQQLFILNSPFMLDQAAALVKRLATECGDEDRARIQRAHQLLLGRTPSHAEQTACESFLSGSANRSTAWLELAQVLLSRNELIYVD